MDITLDCIPCIVDSYTRLVRVGMLPDEAHEAVMRRLLEYLAGADYRQSPPVLGRELHRMIRRELDDPDPYRAIKEESNRLILERYADFEAMVEDADDPFETALRLAIAGNAIDFGPRHQYDVMETIERVLTTPLAIDDTHELRHDLASAGTLLYIGDNCGEIVLDRLFLEHIDCSEKYFAVRGGPVINDATLEDARSAGMEAVARIVTTGDDSPGAVPETASDEFKRILASADVIIAKGQGNLEGLLETDFNVYFLLITKCDLVAERLSVHRGEFVVKRVLNR